MLGGAVTVSVASLLVAVPKAFDTTQRNFAPLSAKAVAAISVTRQSCARDIHHISLPLVVERRVATGDDVESHRLALSHSLT